MSMCLRFAAFAAAVSVAAQPCAAARLVDESSFAPGRVGAFAGAAVTLPFASKGRLAPDARLQFSPTYTAYDMRAVKRVERRGSGVELGLRGEGKIDLRLSGQRPADIKRRLGFKGSTGYIVVGGLLLVALVLVAAANVPPEPGPSKGDF
jgi:hypothetical protein